MPSEPALWVGPGLAVVALGLAVLAPPGSLARALAIGAVAASTGLGLVAWRTASLAAPTLSRPLFSLNVEGRVSDIQRLPDGVRVVLEAVRLRGNGVPPPEMMPAKVRVTLNRGAPPLTIGDRLLRPDWFADPATIGCLLALVREAWGPTFHLIPQGGWLVQGARLPDGGTINLGICATSEAEALVAALEAAP